MVGWEHGAGVAEVMGADTREDFLAIFKLGLGGPEACDWEITCMSINFIFEIW